MEMNMRTRWVIFAILEVPTNVELDFKWCSTTIWLYIYIFQQILKCYVGLWLCSILDMLMIVFHCYSNNVTVALSDII